MKRKGLVITIGIVLLLVVIYLVGPRMSKPEFSAQKPAVPATPELAEQMVLAAEAGIPDIRPGNQSFISWDDSLKTKTAYVLLYLHGFSASPVEGNPVHMNVGKALGMNVYAPRLAEHGLRSENALLNMTPDRLWNSALTALSVAEALGHSVIIMGTSTGGTLALKLAAEYPDEVDGLILCSPNVRIYDKTASLLSKPWGLQIGRAFMGGDFRVSESDPKTDPYWYTRYRVEALVYLQQLIDYTMKASVFEQVSQPTMTAYYYLDEEHQDHTVSVEAIHWMFDNLSTPEEKKESVAYPDAGSHVICSNLTSGSWQKLQEDIIRFIETNITQ